MATKNLKLTIRIPMGAWATKYDFTSYTALDVVRIPRRYPFADISNFDYLKDNGYFRHETHELSSELGGDNTEDAYTKIGYAIPSTERLILLVKKKVAKEETLTISGGIRKHIETETITIPAGAIGDIYEIDMYDLGLRFEDNEEGSVKFTLANDLDMILVTRANS